MKERLCKITAEEKAFYIFTKITDEHGDEKELDVTLSDGQKVWNILVDSEKMSKMANDASMEPDKYWQQTVKALTRNNMGNLQLDYQVKIQEDTAELVWKKLVPVGVKYQLGSLLLTLKTDSSVNFMFDFAINKMMSLEDEIQSVSTDNKRLSSDRSHALKRLEECVTAKEEMENELYLKFIVVLNEKKAKIRRLMSTVEGLSDQISAFQRGEVQSIATTSKVKVATTTSRNRDSEDDTTEDEEENISRSSSPGVEKGESSSSLKIDGKSVISPSLMLDDDETDAAPAFKRRRQREPKPKVIKNVSKLPKVTPIKKTPSASSTSSESSSTSGAKKKKALFQAESQVDVDQLITEMEV